MPTLIDSLVVELGIDARAFTKGQQDAVEAANHALSEIERGAKGMEHQAKRSMDALGGIKTQSLAFFSAITGATGLVQFAAGAIHAGAAVGRLSRNINVSVDTISRFQGLAGMFGGSAESMAQSFIQISDALSGWKIGDIKGIVADFRALGSAGGTIIDINKGVEQTILDIAKNLRVIHDQDPALGGYWQRRLGLDPGLYDAMIQKGENFADLLKKIRGLTDDEAEAAGRLDRRWNSFVGNATRTGQGMVLDLVDSKSKFNPLSNGSDEKDLKMIGGWIDSVFGTNLVSEIKATPSLPGSSAPSPSSASSSPSEKLAWRASIASIESAGSGGYAAVGPVTSSGDRAYGKYQVMGNNIGEWSQAALGKKVSIQEFLASPETQDKIFDYRFGAYVKQFGNPQDAASAWLTGRPLSTGANAADLNGTTGASYAARFTRGMESAAPRPDARPWEMPASAPAGNTTTTKIDVNGPVTINAGPNADGTKIASKFVQTLKGQSFAAQANGGQN